MNIRIKLGAEERTITPGEFRSACERQGVTVKADFWGRVALCGFEEAAQKLRVILEASPELEAALMMDMPELAELLEERAAIMAADGLPASPFEAARATVGK